MNPDAPRGSATMAYAVGILGAFLIVAALVVVMQRYTKPAPIDEAGLPPVPKRWLNCEPQSPKRSAPRDGSTRAREWRGYAWRMR